MDVSLAVELPETQPPEEGIPNFRWATVIKTNPFTIRLDGDSAPLGAVPDSLVDPLNLPPGTRVWVQLFARRALVLGSARGIGVGGGSGGSGGGLTVEQIQDLVATMILAGANISKVYDDAGGTLTLGVTGAVDDGPGNNVLVVYKTGATWPDRPSTDPSVVVFWVSSGGSAPTTVTPPAVNGMYAGDVHVGAASGGGGGTAVAGAAMPAGSISIWASDTPPTDWLICDGQAVSRTAYPVLFTTIGTTYGAGNGTTTFNLPDLKGRVPLGKDVAQTEFNVLGETGGSKTHTLLAAESGVPAHTHNIGHGGGGSDGVVYGGGTEGATFGFTPSQVNPASGIYGFDALSNTAANAVQAHNNLPPYMAVNFIIKATSDGVSGGATRDDIVYTFMGVF
jgi:microcystin-dependent protein